MITTILIDDKADNNDVLRQLLNLYCPIIDVVGSATNIDHAYDLINHFSPKLIFLDIELGSSSGFDLLARYKNISFDVIFITAHSQYAVNAFRENALDYLLKPVNIETLQEAVQKVAEKNNFIGNRSGKQYPAADLTSIKKPLHKIAVQMPDSLMFIAVEDILRCESNNVYTYIYLRDKAKITSTKSIGDYEQLLPSGQFFRIHKSHIINLDYIKKYYRGRGGYVVMEDGSNIEVAARRRDDFLELFNF